MYDNLFEFRDELIAMEVAIQLAINQAIDDFYKKTGNDIDRVEVIMDKKEGRYYADDVIATIPLR